MGSGMLGIWLESTASDRPDIPWKRRVVFYGSIMQI